MSTLPPGRSPELAWKWPIHMQGKASSHAPVSPPLRHVAVRTLVLAVLGGVFFLRHAAVMGWIALGAGGWTLFSALVLPSAFLAVERVSKGFGHLVGMGLTRVLLVAFFFLCLLPLGLILRRQMRGLVPIGFDKNKTTQWLDWAPVSSGDHFQGQY